MHVWNGGKKERGGGVVYSFIHLGIEYTTFHSV